MLNFFRKKSTNDKTGNSRQYSDVTNFESSIIDYCFPYTMTGKDRLLSLIRATEYIYNSEIEGDIVECGVFKGGSMMAVALTLSHLGNTDRKLYLYDTFEGMTEPDSIDISVDSKSAKDLFKTTPDWCSATLEEVKENFATIQYPSNNLIYIKGKVEDTLHLSNHKKISILRLDTDWYQSTKIELEILFDKLAQGGVLIVDDYGHWEGARKAVDEFITNNKIRIFLHRVDYTCRIGIKQ